MGKRHRLGGWGELQRVGLGEYTCFERNKKYVAVVVRNCDMDHEIDPDNAQ